MRTSAYIQIDIFGRNTKQANARAASTVDIRLSVYVSSSNCLDDILCAIIRWDRALHYLEQGKIPVGS